MDNNAVMRNASWDAQGITEDDDSGYLPDDEEEEEEEEIPMRTSAELGAQVGVSASSPNRLGGRLTRANREIEALFPGRGRWHSEI